LALKGDDLPVSAFDAGNLTITNTTQFEKRGATFEVPIWIKENCT
jgi:pyruvate-ferredoxin/flavodoxin oxidoreductase